MKPRRKLTLDELNTTRWQNRRVLFGLYMMATKLSYAAGNRSAARRSWVAARRQLWVPA